jgi:type IV pilus assembly protein PilE
MMAPSVTAPKRCSANGFSLIELLLVLAIMGLVSVLAFPNYQQHLQRGQRAEAAAALLEAEHFMARYYSAHGRYDGSAEAPAKPPELPLRLQRIPKGSEPRYQLSLSAATVNSYELKAEPVGAMASDKCGTLTLNQTGLKGVTGSALSAADCWR